MSYRCDCKACECCRGKQRPGGGNALRALYPLALLTMYCMPTPVPNPREPTDTDQCAAACAHLVALGCEEGQPLEDGTSCTTFCEHTQQSGHALNPTCAKQIKTCAELDACGR